MDPRIRTDWHRLGSVRIPLGNLVKSPCEGSLRSIPFRILRCGARFAVPPARSFSRLLNSDFVTVQATYMAKPGQIERKWHLVDATDEVLGRLASDIAVVLMGKHRPEYTPHVDCGDFVVVTNAEKVAMTGKKMDARHYTWYTGYPGLKLESYGDRQQRKPEDLIYHAVRRMLPKNKLARQMLKKLKIYAGPEHPHIAQDPQPMARSGKKVV